MFAEVSGIRVFCGAQSLHGYRIIFVVDGDTSVGWGCEGSRLVDGKDAGQFHICNTVPR